MPAESNEGFVDLTIFDRLVFGDDSANKAIISKAKKNDPNKLPRTIKSLKRYAFVGTVLGSIFWLYALLQVFAFDVDQALMRILPDQMSFLIEYKFFIYLAIVVVCSILLKKYVFLFCYIIFFPLIVILWKFPKIIYRFKSWLLFFTVMDLVAGMFTNLKKKITIVGAALFSMLAVLTLSYRPILALAILTIAVLLLYVLVKTIFNSFRSSYFFRKQASFVKRVANSNFANTLTLLDDDIKQQKGSFTTEQTTKVLTNLQMAALFHKILYFWAYQLEKYMKSKVSFVLNGLSYVILILNLTILLTFINFCLYKIDPGLYKIQDTVTFISFVEYSINSLFFSEISRIVAVGDLAISIRIASAVMGTLVIGGLVINFLYVASEEKRDGELKESIDLIKKEGAALDARVKQDYEVSIDEAIAKLGDFKLGFISMIHKLSSQLPDGYK